MKRIPNPFRGFSDFLDRLIASRIHNRLVTDTLREIRHTFPRFLSLLILSSLAVCFLAGLRVTAPDMKASADAYFDAQQLMDLRIASTLGLTEDDITALGEEDGIETAQGAYTVDALVPLADQEMVVKLLSYAGTEDVNQPALLEGRLPEAEDECLAEPLFLAASGISKNFAQTGSGSPDALSHFAAVRLETLEAMRTRAAILFAIQLSGLLTGLPGLTLTDLPGYALGFLIYLGVWFAAEYQQYRIYQPLGGYLPQG